MSTQKVDKQSSSVSAILSIGAKPDQVNAMSDGSAFANALDAGRGAQTKQFEKDARREQDSNDSTRNKTETEKVDGSSKQVSAQNESSSASNVRQDNDKENAQQNAKLNEDRDGNEKYKEENSNVTADAAAGAVAANSQEKMITLEQMQLLMEAFVDSEVKVETVDINNQDVIAEQDAQALIDLQQQEIIVDDLQKVEAEEVVQQDSVETLDPNLHINEQAASNSKARGSEVTILKNAELPVEQLHLQQVAPENSKSDNQTKDDARNVFNMQPVVAENDADQYVEIENKIHIPKHVVKSEHVDAAELTRANEAARASSAEVNLKSQSGLITQKVVQSALNMQEAIGKIRSVYSQVADSLGAVLQHKNNTMELRLNPPEWGKVFMRVSVDKHDVNIVIMTEQHLAKDSLDRNMHQLRNVLQEQGLNLNELHIGMGDNKAWKDSGEGEEFFDSRRKNVSEEENNIVPKVAKKIVNMSIPSDSMVDINV